MESPWTLPPIGDQGMAADSFIQWSSRGSAKFPTFAGFSHAKVHDQVTINHFFRVPKSAQNHQKVMINQFIIKVVTKIFQGVPIKHDLSRWYNPLESSGSSPRVTTCKKNGRGVFALRMPFTSTEPNLWPRVGVVWLRRRMIDGTPILSSKKSRFFGSFWWLTHS